MDVESLKERLQLLPKVMLKLPVFLVWRAKRRHRQHTGFTQKQFCLQAVFSCESAVLSGPQSVPKVVTGTKFSNRLVTPPNPCCTCFRGYMKRRLAVKRSVKLLLMQLNISYSCSVTLKAFDW